MADPSIIVAIQNTPGNFLEGQSELSLRIEEMEAADSPPLEEIFNEMVIADLILSPALSVEVTDPTSPEYTGTFMAGDGIEFSGVRYVFGQIVEGQLQIGIIEDGGLSALGGNFIVDASGLSIYGLNLAQYFQSTDNGETRRSYLGMYSPQGSTVPVFSIIFTGDVGTNLLTNGGAEDGDLTGWTDSDSTWQASTETPYEGSYSFFHDGTTGVFPGQLLQNIAVSAGDIVSVEFAHRKTAGILAGKLVLVWKTSAPATISTDYIYGTNSSSWTAFTQSFVAPATTASVDIYWQTGDPFNDEYVDVLDIYVADVTNELRWSDDGLFAYFNGVEYDLLESDSDLDVTTADVTVGNIGTETDAWTTTVIGGTLGADGLIEIDFFGSYLNNSGSTRTLTIKVYYGSGSITILTNTIGVNATRRAVYGKIFLKGNASTGAQRINSTITSTPNDAGLTSGSTVASQEGTYSADSTADQTLKITVQHSTNNANLTFIMRDVKAKYHAVV